MIAPKVLNLALDQWIPIKTRSGENRLVAPWEMTSAIRTDPVVDFDIGRPEMRAAALEFLIGLYSTAFSFEHEAWRDFWSEPLSPEAIKEAFAKLSFAFDLDGSDSVDHPRFMQQREPFLADFHRSDTPDSLLLGGAAENAKLNRTAWLVKERNLALSRPATALALIAQQLYCYGGGVGYYSSLRGERPLSTVVTPVRDGMKMPLYWIILANARPGGGGGVSEEILPWLGLTGVDSGAFRLLTKSARPNLDEIQCFWPMTRRIRLNFRKSEVGERCSLLNIEDAWFLESVKKTNGGLRFDDSGWRHSLSPYEQRVDKITKKSWIAPVQTPDGRISWPNYLGQVVAGQRAGRNRQEPAAVIAAARGIRSRSIGKFMVHAYGPCLVQRDIEVWVEAIMPSHQGGDPETTRLVEQAATAMINAGDLLAGVLGDAVRKAVRSRSGFSLVLGKQAIDAFWLESERSFHEVLEAIASNATDAWDDDARVAWISNLRRLAMDIFGRTAPMTDAINGKCAISGSKEAVPVVEAYKVLRKRLAPFGDATRKAFEILGLPLEGKPGK